MTAACPTRSFAVPPSEAGSRLDAFLGRSFARELSREKIKKAVLSGEARVNGLEERRPARRLLAGELVEFNPACVFSGPPALSPEDKELVLLYQDQDMAVLNKPPGLSVHPSPSEPSGTLAHRLLARFPSLARMGGERPGIVHRLDKDTSGLLLAALHEEARLRLAEAFAARLPRKEYLALVSGAPCPPEGVITAPIGRHSRLKTRMAALRSGGKEALSAYRTLYADPGGRFTLLAVRIHTGRTHQIRVHLAHIGHAVLGDAVYADRPLTLSRLGPPFQGRSGPAALRALAPRQLLHAWKLDLPHPLRDDAQGRALELSFCCPPPEDFFQAALALASRPVRLTLTGNPGCGKSSVLKALARRGIPVWSADEAVAALYAPGADGWRMLRGRFGARFLSQTAVEEQGGGDACRPVDKKALLAAMRADESLRREVEALIHPLVNGAMRLFFQESEAAAARLAAAESPLYFESRAGAGLKEAADAPPLFTAVVRCPPAIRAERLRRNRAWTDSTIAAMESWQWPEEKKAAAADFTLDNSGGPEELELETERLLRALEDKLDREQTELEKTLRRLTAG